MNNKRFLRTDTRIIGIFLIAFALVLGCSALNVFADTPVRQTTVTTPGSGNVLVQVEGDFIYQSKQVVLNRINGIRWEA